MLKQESSRPYSILFTPLTGNREPGAEKPLTNRPPRFDTASDFFCQRLVLCLQCVEETGLASVGKFDDAAASSATIVDTAAVNHLVNFSAMGIGTDVASRHKCSGRDLPKF